MGEFQRRVSKNGWETDKPLDSSREMADRTWKYHVSCPCLFDTGDQPRLTNHILFFFFSDIYTWPTDDSFSTGGSKENLFYHTAAPTDIRHRIVIFHSYAGPFEPPLLPRPVEIDIDDLNLRFSFGHASPPLPLFDPCLRRQTEGHAPTIMADRDSLAFHFLYFISLSLFLFLCVHTLSVIFEKRDALFRPPPITHNSKYSKSPVRCCEGWKSYGLSLPSIVRFHVWSREF